MLALSDPILPPFFSDVRRGGMLSERHGLDCEARHRALGGAKVLWLLAQQWTAERGPDAVRAAVDRLVKTQTMPAAGSA